MNRHDFCNKVSHFIIDEVHERELKTDYLLLLLKTIIDDYDVKLLLMSATMDVQIFSEYFGECEVLKIPGRNFKVDVLHLDEVVALTKYEREIDDHDEIDHNLLNHLIEKIHNSTPANETILVFLPGFDAISEQDALLKENAALRNFRTMILHSEVTDNKNENHEIAFAVSDSKERLIVLATNIAETSITVPGLVCMKIMCLSNFAPQCKSTHIKSLY